MKNEIISYYCSNEVFWIRLFGYGFYVKNLEYAQLTFSERNNLIKGFYFFGLYFSFLKKYRL